MGLNILIKKEIPKTREQLETRLTALKLKHKKCLNYTAWRLLADYLVLRTYDTYFSIHTNGDLEHYEVHRGKYEGLLYEMNNLEFIEQLMNKK